MRKEAVFPCSPPKLPPRWKAPLPDVEMHFQGRCGLQTRPVSDLDIPLARMR